MPVKGPKVKVSRALNLPITPKAARIMERRPFSPGQHGSARKRTASVYKSQLVEKQRLKFTYNISEKQLKQAYRAAAHAQGATGEAMLQHLERRLDAAILRMGFAKTPYASRQYVAHGHFEVNGVRCFNGSMLLKVGDVVTVREKSKAHPQIKDSLENLPTGVEYQEIDAKAQSGKIIAVPSREQIPLNLNEALVVEYYSR
jgi:small subunit ribosomal protein S4